MYAACSMQGLMSWKPSSLYLPMIHAHVQCQPIPAKCQPDIPTPSRLCQAVRHASMRHFLGDQISPHLTVATPLMKGAEVAARLHPPAMAARAMGSPVAQ
mmetsp:Transcript_54091/g.139715  ORF Transcript_54091/g.139715 Transcript_54091/m.139715 type:complete len:100 (+) Transcript_54091:93-392(+)